MKEIIKIKVEEVKEAPDSLLIPKISLQGELQKDRKTESVRSFLLKLLAKRKKRFGILLISFFVLILAFGILGLRVYLIGNKLKSSITNLQKALDAQDFQKLKEELANTQTSVSELQKTYKFIAWTRYIPFLGEYVADGEHAISAGLSGTEAALIVVDTIEPFADIIGFKKDDKLPQGSNETTQDKLDFLIKALPELIPKADELSQKASVVKSEIDEIDPKDYPKTFFGKPIREKIEKGVEMVNIGATLAINGKPLLEASPYLFGVDAQRTYLILFQNDKELRPTGGFITAYSIATVNYGKFESVSSNDIYNLDNLYTPEVPAPEPLRKYIKGPYLISKNYLLRDMNWSPDFYESMKLFTKEVQDAGIEDIDGVIAVDTQLLVNILGVLGEIQVEGYGGYSNNIVEVCMCPQVVYELENFADLEGPIVWSENEPGKIVYAPPNYDNRKKIIGPMMNTILADVLGLPNAKIPALFEALAKSIFEKHVLMFMFEAGVQEAVEKFGLGGRIVDYEGDYLFVNDANLGGRKSNLYVTQEINQDIEIESDGSVVKTLTITYKNPMRHDGWLNSVLPNWVRVYVPKGSELLNFEGAEEQEEAYEEFEKTVFAGYFELRPQGIAKLTLKYKLPFKIKDEYRLLIQKQPGKDAPLYTVNFGKRMEEFSLKTDRELKFSL